MSRRKQRHIDELKEFENIFMVEDNMPGKWSGFFKNDNPIVLGIGCAHGDYTLALAEKFKNKNFIGLDKKGGRLWNGATRGMNGKLANTAFVRGLAEKLPEYFAENEIDEIWVTFPDPFSKPSKENKRLISPKFLELYRHILKPGSDIHLKTDNYKLFEYCLSFVEAEGCLVKEVIRDLHSQKEVSELLEITTFYERKFMDEGLPIYYLTFNLI